MVACRNCCICKGDYLKTMVELYAEVFEGAGGFNVSVIVYCSCGVFVKIFVCF